ncbi:MAG: hypothetical protein ACOC8L_09590 [Spirochaetota bacterium]
MGLRKASYFGIVALVVALVLASCRQPVPTTSGTFFNAVRITDNSWYQVEADLLYASDHALIYVEKGQPVSPSTAAAIGTEFDDNIYDLVRTTFGPELDVDGNGRIILLLLDIQDGFSGSGGYVAGYFDATHAYSTSVFPDSNQADMLFMDVNPLTAGSVEFMSTIVHEMQHMVSFARAVDRGSLQDIWIDEGLSLSSEYLYLGEQLTDRIEYFNSDPVASIRAGNTFYDWDDASQSGTDVLADYSTAYLFFQWLYQHAEAKATGGGVGVLQDIFNSSFADYQAVTAAASARVAGLPDPSSWQDVYSTWLQANLLNRLIGLQGYRNVLSTTVRDHTESDGTIDLPAGGAVYSSISAPYSPGSPRSLIVHQGVDTTTGDVDTTADFSGDRLITFNSSTDGTAVTGAAVPPQTAVRAAAVDAPARRSVFEKPYRIDAPFQREGTNGFEGIARP